MSKEVVIMVVNLLLDFGVHHFSHVIGWFVLCPLLLRGPHHLHPVQLMHLRRGGGGSLEDLSD